MTLSEIEDVISKATAIDFLATTPMVFLIYNTNQEATDAFLALKNSPSFKEELTIFVQYRYDEKIDFSVISKDSADTVKINNLDYAQGKQTYIHMNTLSDFAKTKYNDSHIVAFWMTTFSPDEGYIIPYLSQLTKDKIPGFNVVGFSAKFVPENPSSIST